MRKLIWNEIKDRFAAYTIGKSTHGQELNLLVQSTLPTNTRVLFNKYLEELIPIS